MGRRQGDLSNVGTSLVLASKDGALLLELAQVNDVDIVFRKQLNELIHAIQVAHRLAGVVVLRINLGAQSSAIVRQLHLQPLVQIEIHSRHHEVNAYDR